ncbi:MAG: 50S ribosomal protein L10 [Bdellovibrionales bacterium]|nr:50S ribosomal protein L10 [Bdellovibrionales bacterium]
MFTREQKSEEVAEISKRFAQAKAAFLVDFKGLDVEKVTSLRKLLTPMNSEMKVVKNTLALRAIKEHESYDGALRDHFTGNNAVVFAYEDVSAPAKALAAFSKTNEALVIKTGAMDGKNLNEAQIKYLATLPGKDELRAKLLGTLQAPSQKFVSTLNEVPSSFVRLLAAYRDQKGA